MLHYIKKLVALCFATIIIFSSCAETTATSAEEKTEINSMDSTSKAVKENTDKLEEQTKKVEASIEKVDSEFKPSN